MLINTLKSKHRHHFLRLVAALRIKGVKKQSVTVLTCYSYAQYHEKQDKQTILITACNAGIYLAAQSLISSDLCHHHLSIYNTGYSKP